LKKDFFTSKGVQDFRGPRNFLNQKSLRTTEIIDIFRQPVLTLLISNHKTESNFFLEFIRVGWLITIFWDKTKLVLLGGGFRFRSYQGSRLI